MLTVKSLILRPELITEGKRHPMFLNLIYRVVSNDKHTSRQKAFIKRLLAVSMTAKTPFQAGVLVLFGEFSSKYMGLIQIGKRTRWYLFERLPKSDDPVHVVSAGCPSYLESLSNVYQRAPIVILPIK